jgi:predicted O-linked N-acetylglucosamine transferase (SPINDLY family)
MSDQLIKMALRHHQQGNLAEASRLYSEVLRQQPRHFDALYLLGFAHLQRGAFDDAERLMERALDVNPSSMDALRNRGMALQYLGRHADALANYERALAITPNAAEMFVAKGTALSHLGRHDEALVAYEKAVAVQPNLPVGWALRGNAQLEQGRNEEALASYDRALALEPKLAEGWRNRSLALTQLGRLEEALASLDRTLALRADDADSWSDRGHLLMRLNRHAEAAGAYDCVLTLRPQQIDALYNRGNALSILKRYDEAIRDCEQVLALDPDYPYARGVLVHSRLQCCEWRFYDEDRWKVTAALSAGKRVISPFNHKALSDSASEQLQCAQVWVGNECPPSPTPLWRGERYRHRRVRLAYVSADLNASAVATLIAGVFEHHDRERFEITALSMGSDAQTDMRTRLKNAFEHFVDARTLNENDIASQLRRSETDIAVDLMGYTGACRSRIFTFRPAPLQVNFLGFPGTMGADYMDYIIADRIVVPDGHRKAYAEKIVHLPDTYLPSDRTRAIAEKVPTRAEAGLPERGFVFVSFNNAYKFSPAMFDVWMRILSQVENSVLWLPEHDPPATRNLVREAEARGIGAARLVFAEKVPSPAEHLARLRLADLFLDTLPYNAHSTANDALWAGLPVLTCIGNSFAGRVAASQLNAVGLPELITDSLSAYEALALKLAREPQRLAALRAMLNRNRDSHPLFDTARFTRHLEAAFTIMWERHQRSEHPRAFAVPSLA